MFREDFRRDLRRTRARASTRLQTNEVSRSAGWLLAGCMGFMKRGTPFHLVELGASAGLNLIGDCLPHAWTLVLDDGSPAAPPENWDSSPYPVLSRTGLDRDPVDLADPEARLRLKACLGPDDLEAAARFDRAAGLFLKLAREKTGPRLERVSFAEAPARLGGFKPHPEEGLLVFNGQAGDFLDDGEHAALKAGMAVALAPWEDRAFWAELELPRGRDPEAGPVFHELRVHRLMDGRLETRVLARLTGRPREIMVLPGWDFLRPLNPVTPPRNTREEPIRRLAPGAYQFPRN